MLGAHQSDPPDVPSLHEAGNSLLTLVNSESLTVSLYCIRRLLYTYSQSASIHNLCPCEEGFYFVCIS